MSALEDNAAVVEEAPRGAPGDLKSILALLVSSDLTQRHVRGLVYEREDRLVLCADLLRAPIAASRSRPIATRAMLGVDPLNRRWR